MSLVITPNKHQALSVKNQLLLLSLPANKRTRILKTLGRHERQLARKRIRSQTTVDGSKFAGRANGKKAKMLKRMGRTLEPFVKKANRLELKHKQTSVGRIAALHQDGGSETMTAGRMARIHGMVDYDAPATRSQAKALIALGYKTKKTKGKGYRRATITEIVANLNQRKAGFILKTLRDNSRKTRWSIPVKARPFLGDSTVNVQRELVKIIKSVNS
ncbi:phage virion morphogenesis protein [Shewanella sp.]|uniref:phage virion morphogenesis protein n=1 Tax=Shewanella sp. TaxID=50422 RepID=UPI0035686506